MYGAQYSCNPDLLLSLKRGMVKEGVARSILDVRMGLVTDTVCACVRVCVCACVCVCAH